MNHKVISIGGRNHCKAYRYFYFCVFIIMAIVTGMVVAYELFWPLKGVSRAKSPKAKDPKKILQN